MTMTVARTGGGDPFGAPTPTRESLRVLLRRETAIAHQRVDGLFGVIDLTTGAGLARFLAAHALALRSVQPAAAEFLTGRLGAALPDALAMIAADLAEIGCPFPPALADDAPLPGDGGAGVAYVLLGSRMGMAALVRRGTWAARNGRAGRYLGDERLGALWPPLRGWLRDRPGEGPAAAATLAGALAAFARFAAAARAMGLREVAPHPAPDRAAGQ